VTKTFFIRYAEETVNLRHVIKFRTEIDCKQFHKEGITEPKLLAEAHKHATNPFLNTEFFLKVELYYSQPPQHNFAKLVNSPELMKAEVNKSSTKFKCVQTKLYQINNCMHSQSTFLPVEFDREYTSLCMLTCHSSMINFVFNASTQNRPLKPMHIDEDDEESVQTFMENGILVERKYVQEPTMGEESTRPKWKPANISQYLFYNEFGSLDVNEHAVVDIYKSYQSLLSYAHEQLRQNYLKLALKTLT
jgi:hypothetical protein